MNVGGYMTLCDCLHKCKTHSYFRYCAECQILCRLLIRKQVIGERVFEYETYQR